MKISKELKVGLFMVSALVLLYFGFNFLKGVDFFASNHNYYTVYENVDKLTLSNQVYINGVQVGRVSDYEILQRQGNKVLVELEIDSDIVLGKSTVAILTGDFLGNKSIMLDNIEPKGGALSPNDTMQSALDRSMTDILAESALPVADNLQITMRKFNVLVENLTRMTQRMDTIFIGLERTPFLINKSLYTAQTNINDLSLSFKEVADNLNVVMKELKPTLANFKTVSDSVKAIQIGGTVKKLNQTLTKTNEMLTRLNKGDNTASKLMTDDELYNNLNKLLLNLDTLANHFNTNPKHFMAPLGKDRKYIEREMKKEKAKQATSK
jgi:phospholipid/cholesterol/gamma-HCH transport system substrate-binding protein